MAKAKQDKIHTRVVKRSKQGGKTRLGTMNKAEKRNFKEYRGQGRA